MKVFLFKARGIVAIFALCGATASSFALDKASLTVDKEAGDIQIGPFTAYPSIELGSRYDDNLFLSASNEQSELIGIVKPEVKLLLQDNIKSLTLGYGIEAGLHENRTTENYVAQKLLGVFAYHPTTKIKTELQAEYLDQRDPIGTARTEGFGGVLESDEWHSYGIRGLVGYGSPNATGRIEFESSYVEKEYDNNRQFTFVRDRNDLKLRGTFYYKIRPKTQLLFEINQTDFEYEKTFVGGDSLDSTNRNYLFGVVWNRTHKMTGYAGIGYAEKNFDVDSRNDVRKFKWETGTRWRFRTYSMIDISTERRQDESNGIGDSIDVGEFKVSWNHEWRDHISSRIDFLFGEDDYNPAVREDSRFGGGLKLNYDWRRWVKISAGYQYEKRDSNVDIFDYKRNLFSFTVNLVL